MSQAARRAVPVERLPDWEHRLMQTAEGLLGQPFAWGQTDCAQVVLACVDAMLGTDHRAAHRGRYRDRQGARDYQRARTDLVRWLRGLGAASVADVRFAQRGDVVTVQRGPWVFGHVVLGARVMLSSPNEGVALGRLRALTTLRDAQVWRVG